MGCHPQSASFKVIELDFLTYLLIDVKPWSFVREFELSMLMSPFVIHRGSLLTSSCVECCHSCLPLPMSLKPLFCSELLNSIMYAWWNHSPSSSSLLSSLSPSCFSSPLLRRFSPAYRIEHIPKYSSIEKFVKLPFQQVVIRFKRSPNERVMTVLL